MTVSVLEGELVISPVRVVVREGVVVRVCVIVREELAVQEGVCEGCVCSGDPVADVVMVLVFVCDLEAI